jgi:hypothetical protein
MNAWGQLVINSSGDFALGTNISGSTGILINASNVTLNLNQQTVSSSINGIEISAGVSNVTIYNGTISTSSVGLVINQNCSNIFVQDLLIQNCTTAAININGSSGNLIQRGLFKNIKIDSCCTTALATLVGIRLNFVRNLHLQDINFISNGTSSVTQLTGLAIQNSSQVVFDNVDVENNTADQFIGVDCTISSDSCVFKSCSIIDNSGTTEFTGFFIQQSTNHLLNKCLVANNATSASGSALYGFRLVSATGVGIFDCDANSNSISGSGGSSAYGFYYDTTSLITTVGCKSLLNTAINGASLARGFFIGGGSGVNNSGFFNNLAFGNTGSNNVRSFGFNATHASGGNVNNTYINNRAIRNGTTAGNQITTGAGGVPLGSVTTITLSTLGSGSNTTNLTNTRVT